ncbi:MAG: hypothetical protein WA183_11785 [Chthoniobacterales bacterium]
MNTHEIVSRFAGRIPNPRKSGAVEWRGARSYLSSSSGFGGDGFVGARIYCESNTLYSYGPHFALVHYLGERDSKSFFLKNGDRASQTTSRQQAEVQELCAGPTVSFSAFAAAGIDLSPLRAENVLDFAEDTRVYITREKETGTFYRLGKWNSELGEYERGEVFAPPTQGAFFPDRSQPEKNGFVSGVWHVVAACLIHLDGRYLLSAIDEGSYFVSELSLPAKSIREAFALLKPREVRKAEAKGATVLRQGEWFFIATEIKTDRDLARMLNLPRLGQVKIDSLPRPKDSTGDALGNCHRCFVVEHGGELWARGTVRHQHEERRYVSGTQTLSDGRVFPAAIRDGFTYRATREHAALNLGKEWHRVYRNTELGSWTAARTRWTRGGVD